MWAGWGWWCGAGAALLAAACLLLCRRSRTNKVPAAGSGDSVVEVHVVREEAGRPYPRAGARHAEHGPPRPPAPRVMTHVLGAGDQPSPSTSRDSDSGIPKLPLPEQWVMHNKSFDCKYSTRIPRPLAHIELGADLQESRATKLSATRSPSLEKDDRSPFLGSDVFGFETPCGSGRAPHRMDSDQQQFQLSDETDGPNELPKTLSSPDVLEPDSAHSKCSTSPKQDSLVTPKFFTPPEHGSPTFFAEQSPKSVYYDSVRSPKFFPDTPLHEVDGPQSPMALLNQKNRNNGVHSVLDKPPSPRIVNIKPKSPKVNCRNKENYFTFDQASVTEDAAQLSPKPETNSTEKELLTPPIDNDVKKYRRHNSCDTNYKNIEICITDMSSVDAGNKDETGSKDVVDCCAKIESIDIDCKDEGTKEKDADVLIPKHSNTAQVRRQRLKSISLDSDNAKIIELNLGMPIAKQLNDDISEGYKNQGVSLSCYNMERGETAINTSVRPVFEFDQDHKLPEEDEEHKSPDLKNKKSLRQSDTHSFHDMPRFSPKEFEITVTSEEGSTTPVDTQAKKKGKNLRNLTIDLTKRDSELEKELLEFEKLYANAEENKVKTPTLKVKATSLDSSETVNLSLPQKQTLEVPQNSVSVPNTPKRQMKRILAQKKGYEQLSGGKIGYNYLQYTAEQRKMFLKTQDSGIFLRENHANLMLYQPGPSRFGSRTMGSFDENMADYAENTPEINISSVDTRYHCEMGQSLGTNLLNYKPNLSVSSTNLKTLPEGVPSDDFEPSVEDEKFGKKLHRRNSNQSIMYSLESKYSTHSLQSSNCSLSSAGASSHNLATVRTSISNFSLSTDNRQKKLSLEKRDSNASMGHLTPTTRVICSSNTNVSGDAHPVKNCLLQRRGSNNSLTLNIQCSNNNLSRHSSNSSLNKDGKIGQKKGLLERRSSNTSLTLNINNSNPQLSVNRALSISNYTLNGSTCNLSRYNSNQSIDNSAAEPRKGILERRSSNTSLTLNIRPQEPREAIEKVAEEKTANAYRKSLSTENLIPKCYKSRLRLCATECKPYGFGSHDNLWSSVRPSAPPEPGPEPDVGFVRNISTKPLSPQSTSEDFRLYLANMHQLQTASSVLAHRQLQDLHEVFQNGYSDVKCSGSLEGQRCCTGRVLADGRPCAEYQKLLLRGLHQEFWDMPTNFQEKPIVSGSHTKNRYKTILPNEHSRVILPGDRYINANYIKGYDFTKNSYIATQGPLPNTIYDFWLMVYQNYSNCPLPPEKKIQTVVMLTNFVENNRQKCEKYFPLETDEELVVEDPEAASPSFRIRNEGTTERDGYSVRALRVSGAGTAAVQHYWFPGWADHRCPADPRALLRLCAALPGPERAPGPVVHCSAGIGRTGCLLAVLSGARQLRVERRVDVLAIVSNMRLDRGGMVQNSEQYELVHKVLAALHLAGDSDIL